MWTDVQRASDPGRNSRQARHRTAGATARLSGNEGEERACPQLIVSINCYLSPRKNSSTIGPSDYHLVSTLRRALSRRMAAPRVVDLENAASEDFKFLIQ